MKRILFFLLAALLVLPYAALAGDQPVMTVKIIDKDPKGANVRDAPSGKVVYTVPLKPKDELERESVAIRAKKGQWFEVELESGKTGWMHGSVLGLRSAATEDGPCTLMQSPSEEARAVIKSGRDAVLQLLDYTTEKGFWIKVRYTDAKGMKHDGWVPEQCQ